MTRYVILQSTLSLSHSLALSLCLSVLHSFTHPCHALVTQVLAAKANRDELVHMAREQVRRLERKVEREKIVLASLPDLSLQIVEFAREHGRITMADAIRLTGSSRNTLKQHFRALVERGQLSLHGAGRGVWYELR